MAGQSAVTLEEHRPKKLLDQVRACPACGEGMRRVLSQGRANSISCRLG